MRSGDQVTSDEISLPASSPFAVRLLAALANPGNFDEQSRLLVESWVRFADASAAILVSPQSSEVLQIICCRSAGRDLPHFSVTQADHPFSVLLDRGSVAEILAGSGLLGGLHMEILQWPDLAACLVVQNSENSTDSGIRSTLSGISRRLLSDSSDRPLLIPHYATLEAMAEYAAGAGHEINNPLASIVGQTQLLLRNEQSTERRQALETIGAQAWRIRDMIGNSMLFARPPLLSRQRINLVSVVKQALVPLTAAAAEDDIEIQLASTSDSVELLADQTQISVLVTHLVRNSLESIRGTLKPGVISVTLRDDQPGSVEISVVDNGPGILSEQVRRHLFNPFFSGRSAGRGLGFGLSLAWQIVRLHDGILLHETPPGGGSAFHIALGTGEPIQL